MQCTYVILITMFINDTLHTLPCTFPINTGRILFKQTKHIKNSRGLSIVDT